MKLKYLILIVFLFSKLHKANSQIVNEGQLKIESGTSVFFENEYTNKSTGNHECDGDFYLNSNFINDGLTNSSSGTTYFKSATNNLVTISGTTNSINFYNLQIDITAASTNGVSVADNFALNIANSINFISGDLRLLGEAQLIQSHTGVNSNTIVSGKLILDQQGYNSAYQYNYWSSPISNAGSFSLLGGKFDGSDSAVNPFNPTQISFNSGSPFNGLPSVLDGSNNVVTPLTINTRWLYKYTRGNGSYSDWISLDENSPIFPGEGYIMKGTNAITANQNYVFYGEPNNGNYNFPITLGEQSLLGNPYPSALDANKFISDNLTVLDALYFWVDGGSTSHNLTDYLGGYAIRNLTGGTPPSIASPLISGIGNSGTVTAPTQYVAVAQGFFIDAIGSGNITFNNSQRIFKTEASGDAVFYRSTNNTIGDDQYIRLGYEDPEGFHRQLLLGFLPESPADTRYNPGYDAVIAGNRNDDMFFIIENNYDKRYAIQGVNSFIDDMEFPIGVTISETGSHQIILDEIVNFNNPIYLKDNYLNTYHDLSQSRFYVNLPIGNYFDRYSIVFKTPTLSVSNPTINNVNVFYDGINNIVITNIKDIELNNIEIYNVIGQQILMIKNNLNNQDRIEIPFNETDGVYLIVLNTSNSKKSTKILKY